MHRSSRARGAAGLLALLLMTAGCANRAKFTYPTQPSLLTRGELVGALHGVCDRLADREIEAFYEERVANELTAALHREMEASGAFARVEALPGCVTTPSLDALRADGIAIVVQPQVDRMQWVVPDYAQIRGTAMAVSLLFGVVGGVAYGMTDTEVFGHVELRVALLDTRSGALLERTYTGEASREMDKLASDTPETRRRMIGLAFDEAMKPFREDLRMLAAAAPGTAADGAAAALPPTGTLPAD